MTPAEVARHLRDGGLAALPTETVYGLAADAGDEDAVRRVFEIKGRPSTNPLIVHVANAGAARRVTAAWPEAAAKLAETYWPGPLTIVLPKGSGLAATVTAGGDTVGVRVPSHPLTLDVLRRFHELGGLGLAMPSANVSEHVSPTTAEHVRGEFGDKVPIVDGGPCGVGIESTVVSLAGQLPTVLRLGEVMVAELERVAGRVQVRGGSDAGVAASPGRQARHYAPSLPCTSFERDERDEVVAAARDGSTFFLFCGDADRRNIESSVNMPSDPADYARRLYAAFRDAESRPGVRRIEIEMPPDKPVWAAVRDRLQRATAPLEESRPAAG